MAVALFLRLDGLATVPAWAVLLLAFAPDLSMVGYLAGPRVGARTYNAVDTYVAPLLLAAVGSLLGSPPAVLLAVIWAGHVGVDRALGYGLKYPTAFGDTHLDRLAPTGGPSADEGSDGLDAGKDDAGVAESLDAEPTPATE